MKQANERITTVEDGPATVNERLSTGGTGPEGQPDTVTESLSGAPAVTTEPVAEPVIETDEDEEPGKKRRRS